jgi:hypothetical protein
MSFMNKVKSWWRKDDLERAEEEARAESAAERDEAEEDYSGQRADTRMKSGYYEPAAEADFERDSERPGH